MAEGIEEHFVGDLVSHSKNLEDYRNTFNETFYPARVEPQNSAKFMAPSRLSAAHLRLSTIGFVQFGTSVSVNPGDLGYYHLNLPLRGRILSYCGRESTWATPQKAAVYTPGRPTFLPAWDPDTPQWCWKISRISVENELEGLIAKKLSGPIEFSMSFDLSTPAGKRWLSGLHLMINYINELGDTPSALHHVENLERTLISGLLLTQHHSYTPELQNRDARQIPAAMHKVIEVIKADPAAPYTLGDLARLADVSARQLQYVFSEATGYSPMTYLRQVRLDEARRLIVDSGATVSEAATQAGFNHLGKFTQYYQERFEEKPSSTRKRLR